MDWLGLATSLLIFCFGLVLFVVLGHYLQRYAFNYRLADSSVQALLFGKVPIYRVRYERIEEIRVIPFKEALRYQFAVHAGNRLGGPVVLIRRKRRPPVLITPANANEFAREVERRVNQESR